MTYRNGKDFRRFLNNSFFHNKGTNYRLTSKRLSALLTAVGIYIPAQLVIWTGLYLDEVFFPSYRQIKIKEPVFIIGNPRSGTTFLQRLLARDTANFLSMKTWEIFGAPSITMRKVFRMIVQISRSIGVQISKRIKRLEKNWREDDIVHRFRLREVEEDENLFIHIFSTMRIWSFAAMEEEAEPYIYFDQQMSAEDKTRIMDYYESCLQRHYYYHCQTNSHYLSKNPNFSPTVKTLLEKFKDAKFIYLIRNPLEAVPSHISLKEREWQSLGSPLTRYACKDFIMKSSEHWYDYTLNELKKLPSDQAVIIKFEDLVKDADRTVHDIYSKFGLDVTPEFQEILEEETTKARNHVSKHHYSLEEMGIDKEEMLDRFQDVITEFGYSNNK